MDNIRRQVLVVVKQLDGVIGALCPPGLAESRARPGGTIVAAGVPLHPPEHEAPGRNAANAD